MRRIFLHAGQTKTGTTAIQTFLGEHREQLLRLGYLFPRAGLSHIYNHAPLVADILGEQSAPKHRNAGQALKAEMEDNADANVIISAERLFRYLQMCSLKKIDEPKLIAFLLSTGLPLTFISYVRPREDWANSKYIQGVKSFYVDVSFAEYVVEETKNREVRLAELPRRPLPPGVEWVFRPFNEEVRRTGVGRDFMSAIGLSEAIAGLGAESRVNDSIGPIAIAASLATRLRMKEKYAAPTFRQCDALRKRLLELIAQEEPEASFYGVDEAKAQFLEEHFREDSEEFAQAAWGRSWTEVFPPRDKRKEMNILDPATAAPEALDRYNRLADALWATAQSVMEDDKLSVAPAWERPRPRHVRGQKGRLTPTRILKRLEARRRRDK